MLDKIQFNNGLIVTSEYLNEVQKGTSFSAAASRENYFADPASSDHAGWQITQRDRLKDWELADPRQDQETSVGRLAHDGIVLNSYNPETLEKIWGPPALQETTEGSGVYGVWVEGGSFILSDGTPVSWGIQFVQLLSGIETNYLYIDESGARESLALGGEIGISAGSALPSVSQPHVPLAKLTFSAGGTSLSVGETGSVYGAGYVDLRPNLYVGNLNSYPRTLRNTEIKNDSYVASSWERVIADTSNGSIIISLPESPTDSDRIALVDISGTFDRYPIVIRPGDDTKINNSVDDWIINVKDAHVELFFHAATSEWKFEEAPGGDCAPALGSFLSCGGREFLGQRLASECPDGAVVPVVYPDAPEAVYRYEASSGKCYREFYETVAVYANGQGGLIRVQNTPRCDRDGVIQSNRVRNIIYVDPSIGDDSVSNNGFEEENPFRTIERALIEGVRESRREGLYNDRYDRVVVQLAPGDYYVDNAPGSSAVPGLTSSEGLVQRVEIGQKILGVEIADRATIITVDALNPTITQPPVGFNLGRVLYSASGGVGNIAKLEKESLNSPIWKITLEYARGVFSPNDDLYYDALSIINPLGGGIVVPRGISIDGVDLRKVRVRPMYIPELSPVQHDPQAERTSIFKVTGGSYISLMTFTDNPQIQRSHNTVTSITFASQQEINGGGAETSYYSKLNSLFAQYDNWGSEGLEPISAETTIVAPVYGSKALRSADLEENLTGLPFPDDEFSDSVRYPGPAKLRLQGDPNQTPFSLPDVNSTRSSSPYVFNCSVRSIFGLNGMWADGSLVGGFKSMVVAQFTQVSLQTDPTCFTTGSYFLDPPTSKEGGVGKQYRPCNNDLFKYRHFGIRGSNDATIQAVSVFVIGNADHFVSQNGADLSVTNSCSDFGDISLRSIGYKTLPFSQDGAPPEAGYSGTLITKIIPPLPLTYSSISPGRGPTLVDTEVNTGLVLDYELTTDYVIENTVGETVPSPFRIYFRSSNASSPFNATTTFPSAKRMGFGQFSYTRKKLDNSYELSGGGVQSRKRLYIKGFDEIGNSISYTGDIVLMDPIDPFFDELDDASKVFFWDDVRECWYVKVLTGNIVEETTDLDGDGFLLKKFDHAYRYKVLDNPTGSDAFYAQLDFLFPRSSITTIRGIDRRKNEERIYKVVLDGFNKPRGLRRPQSYYILEKQTFVPGYPLNGSFDLLSEPLCISQVRTYDEVFNPDEEIREFPDTYVAYVTKSNDSRRVPSGDLYPDIDPDNPESTEDPVTSITRRGLELMLDRPGVHYEAAIGPSSELIDIKVEPESSTVGIPIELRRPSIIRASGHTWEWTGYLNYDTAFPTFQGDPLEQEFALGKILVEEGGGRVYATGMNEEGSFYIGTTVFDLRTGEQFAIPLEAGNEPGSVTNQVFNSVVIRSVLAMGDGSNLFFGNGTSIFFDATTTFNTTIGPVSAGLNPLPEVYATTAKAGLVQLADDAVIRGALGAGGRGIADRVVVTAGSLARELNLRDGSLISAGIGITVTPIPIEAPGGDPNDPADDILTWNISSGLPGSTDIVSYAGLRLSDHVNGQVADEIRNSVAGIRSSGQAQDSSLVSEKAIAFAVDTLTVAIADAITQFSMRRIDTGDGLNGGGDLSANRTLSVNNTVVRTSRLINTGDGLNGGGNLNTDRTLSVDNTVVRTSRLINSGDGLTGGGNLTNDRTINVDGTVVRTTRSINTGAGLLGGGNLGANLTLVVDFTSVVATSRSILAGDGISGGGNLSTDRTINVDGTVVRTSRLINSGDGINGGGNLNTDRTLSVDGTVVRTTRLISPGTGLSGGGDLSANRTLSVDGTVVRTSRAINTGAGLTGGGDLGANRTLVVDFTSVVPTSRTITAGDGLSGGGNLSANRSLSVDGTVVRTSGAQTIAGVKTFTSQINANNAGDAKIGFSGQNYSINITGSDGGDGFGDGAGGNFGYRVVHPTGTVGFFLRQPTWNGSPLLGCRGTYFHDSSSGLDVRMGDSYTFGTAVSSRRYKTDITDLDSSKAVDLIANLRPVKYKSTTAREGDGKNPDWTYYGLISEEVAEVEPRLAIWGKYSVDEEGNRYENPGEQDDYGPNSVDYARFVVPLIATMQEQLKLNRELLDRIEALEQQIDA